MNAVYFDPWSNLRYEPEPSPADDPNLLWFNSDVNPDDVLEASEHRTQFEFSVDGKKRIKPGSKHTTVGTKTTVNGKTIAIFKHFGRLYAINNVCPHQRVYLESPTNVITHNASMQMGVAHSKKTVLQPQNQDPSILFQTETGVIVRSLDVSSGQSRYDFNPRYVPTDSVGGIAPGPSAQEILTVKQSPKNPTMKDKLVYVKVPPKGLQSRN